MPPHLQVQKYLARMNSFTSAISTRRAVIHSALAVYTPTVAMALYALGFVSSSYAQSMMWKLLPCAPGLLPVEAIRRLLGLPRPQDSTGFAWAFVFTLAVVAMLAALVRRGGWLRLASLVVATVLSGAAAFSLLSALQS